MTLPWWLLGRDRRQSERRIGERRSPDRCGPGRRDGDRRRASTRAVVLSLLAVAAPSWVKADVFTRRGAGGVLEATNVPDREGFQLAYRSKGPVTHSPEFRL